MKEGFSLVVVALGIAFQGCGKSSAKPSYEDIAEHVYGRRLTPLKEEWAVIHISSIEISSAVKNNGLIKNQPNEKIIFPVTVIYDTASRGWAGSHKATGTIRDDYMFVGLEKSWGAMLIQSENAGSILNPDLFWEKAVGESKAFSKEHLDLLGKIENLPKTTSALLEMKDEIMRAALAYTSYSVTSNDISGLKLTVELFDVYRYRCRAFEEDYRARREIQKTSPELDRYRARLDELWAFAGGEVAVNARSLWDKVSKGSVNK